jgi:hypothetical protein
MTEGTSSPAMSVSIAYVSTRACIRIQFRKDTSKSWEELKRMRGSPAKERRRK